MMKVGKLVTVVFVDRSTREVTAAEAWELCSNAETAGQIIDVLTEDAELQATLRKAIDSF